MKDIGEEGRRAEVWPAGWHGWVEAFGSFLFPEVCDLCGEQRATARESFVCQRCRSAPGNLRRVREPYCDRCGLPYSGEMNSAFVCANCAGLDLGFDAARSAVVATRFLLEVIHRYKYDRATWLEPFLSELLVEAAAPSLASSGPWDALVPVPLHPVREREREFNQSVRLARRLSRATGIPCREDVVRRRLATGSQALLDRGQRAKNVADAFGLRRPLGLGGWRVVVVDDVLTTGATTGAVGRVLRQAGAVEVRVWTVARGT